MALQEIFLQQNLQSILKGKAFQENTMTNLSPLYKKYVCVCVCMYKHLCSTICVYTYIYIYTILCVYVHSYKLFLLINYILWQSKNIFLINTTDQLCLSLKWCLFLIMLSIVIKQSKSLLFCLKCGLLYSWLSGSF